MIDRREILEAASALSLLPSIVEQDYVLGPGLIPYRLHRSVPLISRLPLRSKASFLRF
jgi:hypothetical protein